MAAGRVPNTAGEIIRNRYGDRVQGSHALLLHHLLNAAGIPAHLALVRAVGPLCTDAPSLDQFDHLIVCVPAAVSTAPVAATTTNPATTAPAVTDQWFDCTDKSTDLTCGIPLGLAEKEVLVLDPAKSANCQQTAGLFAR